MSWSGGRNQRAGPNSARLLPKNQLAKLPLVWAGRKPTYRRCQTRIRSLAPVYSPISWKAGFYRSIIKQNKYAPNQPTSNLQTIMQFNDRNSSRTTIIILLLFIWFYKYKVSIIVFFREKLNESNKGLVRLALPDYGQVAAFSSSLLTNTFSAGSSKVAVA